MRITLGVLLVLAACSREPIATRPLLLSVSSDRTEVKLGEAFSLDVRRVWRSDAVPSIWSDDMLAPLHVELIGSERREDDTHTEEIRQYRARAFLPGALTVAGLSFRSRRGTTDSEVFSQPLDLVVEGEIDPERPGALERPELSSSNWWIWIGAVAVLLLLVVRRKRPPAVTVEREEPLQPVHELALTRLAAVDAAHLYRDSMPILRDFLSARHSFDAHASTSQELARQFPLLHHALSHSVDVRFGGKRPTDTERNKHRAELERSIREMGA